MKKISCASSHFDRKKADSSDITKDEKEEVNLQINNSRCSIKNGEIAFFEQNGRYIRADISGRQYIFHNSVIAKGSVGTTGRECQTPRLSCCLAARSVGGIRI